MIKKAYYKLAMTHHPDKGGDTEEFQKIGDAYQARPLGCRAGSDRRAATGSAVVVTVPVAPKRRRQEISLSPARAYANSSEVLST